MNTIDRHMYVYKDLVTDYTRKSLNGEGKLQSGVRKERHVSCLVTCPKIIGFQTH